MHPLETLTLGTFEKWKQHRRIPVKMIVRICIVISTTAAVIVSSNELTSYVTGGEQALQALLFPDFSAGRTSSTTGEPIFTKEAVLSSVNGAIERYYALNETAVGTFFTGGGSVQEFAWLDDRKILKDLGPSLTVWAHSFSRGPKGGKVKSKVVKHDVPVNSTTRFDDATMDFPLKLVAKVVLTFGLYGMDLDTSQGSRLFRWDVTGTYDFQGGSGAVALTVRATHHIVNKRDEYTLGEAFAIVVLMLSIVGALLSIKALLNNIRAFLELKRGMLWSSLPLKVRFKFVNPWFVFAVMGDCFLATSTIIYLVSVNESEPNPRATRTCALFMGAGTLISLVSCLHYLTEFRHYDVLIRTMRKALPRITRFVVSITPIYMGFILFGVALFSQCTPLFRSTVRAAFTLLGVMNGDGMVELFTELSQCPYPIIVSHTYAYIFCIFFIYTSANIFIFVVEDAYHAGKGIDDKGQPIEKQGLLETFGDPSLLSSTEREIQL